MPPMRPAPSRSGKPRRSALARAVIPDGASLGARVFFGLLALSLLSIAATSVFAIVSRGNGTEDVAGRFGPIRAGVVVAMATAGTAFALVLGTPVLTWLREGERPGFAAIAFPAGLVVSCATVVVLMATMPKARPRSPSR